jgi:hypothetical protein
MLLGRIEKNRQQICCQAGECQNDTSAEIFTFRNVCSTHHTTYLLAIGFHKGKRGKYNSNFKFESTDEVGMTNN